MAARRGAGADGVHLWPRSSTGTSAGVETLFYIAIAAQSAFALPHARRVERLLHVADGPARELVGAGAGADAARARVVHVAGSLAELQTELRRSGVQASVAIARLRRLSEMHDWQHNLIFVGIALLLMWSTHLAWALEAWRRRYGRHVRRLAARRSASSRRSRRCRPTPTSIPPIRSRSSCRRRRHRGGPSSKGPASAIRWCRRRR